MAKLSNPTNLTHKATKSEIDKKVLKHNVQTVSSIAIVSAPSGTGHSPARGRNKKRGRHHGSTSPSRKKGKTDPHHGSKSPAARGSKSPHNKRHRSRSHSKLADGP